MKYLLLASLLALNAFPVFAQTSLAEMELNAAVFNRPTGLGFLTFNVKVDQNLQNFNRQDLRNLKISLANYHLTGKNVQIEAEFLSYQQDKFRVDGNEDYKVTQFELFHTEIAGILPLGHGFEVVVKAHYGLGFTSKKNTEANNIELNEAEFEILQAALNCPNCAREGIPKETAGGYTYDRGLSITLNKDQSYFKVYASEKRSGGYHRLLDEEGEAYAGGYRAIYDWEARKVTPVGIELGHTFKKIPLTVFTAVEKTTFRSEYNIAEQGDKEFESSQQTFKRGTSSNLAFKVGFRVKLKGIQLK